MAMDASKDYSDNMFGASYVSQFLKKKKKKDQEVSMSCSEHGCAAYESGGGGSDAGSSRYKQKDSSGPKGEKSKVLSKKEADKRAKEFEENRTKASQRTTMFDIEKSKF